MSATSSKRKGSSYLKTYQLESLNRRRHAPTSWTLLMFKMMKQMTQEEGNLVKHWTCCKFHFQAPKMKRCPSWWFSSSSSWSSTAFKSRVQWCRFFSPSIQTRDAEDDRVQAQHDTTQASRERLQREHGPWRRFRTRVRRFHGVPKFGARVRVI